MTESIKLRQLANSHLCAPVPCHQAVQDLCGVQAQFWGNAVHALSIRASDGVSPRRLLKSWTIRGTMHLFAVEDLPLFLHEGRSRFLRPCDTMGADEWISAERKEFFANRILEYVSQGTTTREALKAACCGDGLTQQEAESVFNPWGGTLRALCEQGLLAHAPGQEKAFCLCPPFVPMEQEAAERELLRRYFRSYGPATVADSAYFFHVSQAKIRRHLPELPLEAETVDGKTYYGIPTGIPVPERMPSCLFLAGFDPLLLGHEKRESLFLPQAHLRKVFTMAGIVHPTVLFNGEIAAKWKKTGEKLTITPFSPLLPSQRQEISQSAEAIFPGLKQLKFLEE